MLSENTDFNQKEKTKQKKLNYRGQRTLQKHSKHSFKKKLGGIIRIGIN